MKSFFEKTLAGLPYITLFCLAGITLLIVLQNGMGWDRFLALLGVVIWPIVVLMALLFFRRVFTYLFFSIEEFNFFGARGKLKSVEEVILEKVQQLHDADVREKEIAQNQEALKKQIETLRQTKDSSIGEWKTLAEKALNYYKESTETNTKLMSERETLQGQTIALQQQVQALLEQIRKLQEFTPKG